MKKINSIVLGAAVSLFLGTSFVTPIQANDNLYSIFDYCLAVQDEAEKYGIEVTIFDYDTSKPITEQTIEYGVESVQKFANSIQIKEVNTSLESSEDKSASRAIIPERRTRSKSHIITCAFGAVNITVQATADVDVNALRIMYVYSTNAYPNGYNINFSSWSTESISQNDNSPSDGYLSGRVIGLCSFTYADPITGISTGYSSREGFDYTINFR